MSSEQNPLSRYKRFQMGIFVFSQKKKNWSQAYCYGNNKEGYYFKLVFFLLKSSKFFSLIFFKDFFLFGYFKVPVQRKSTFLFPAFFDTE